MLSLPSQPRIIKCRSFRWDRLKITLFSSKTLPLTGLPQDKIISDIDLNPSLTSTSFRTTKILCSWSTVKLAKLCVREKKRVYIAHWCFREIRARFYILHFRESRPDYHVPRILVDHANLTDAVVTLRHPSKGGPVETSSDDGIRRDPSRLRVVGLKLALCELVG